MKQPGTSFHYLTSTYLENGNLPENQAEDGLHPSGSIYRYWAEKLAGHIREEVKF